MEKRFLLDLTFVENELDAGIHSPRCAIVTSVHLNLSLLLSQLFAPEARIIPMCQSMERLSVVPRNQNEDEVNTAINNKLAISR